ncbi:MAG: isochorismatase family protein [Planctomycetes bacterium]|nr:isochorismatase family protein [Planctomycetota bacterium]
MTAPSPDNRSEQPAGLPRSPELMRREDTAMLVVDVQERLVVVQTGIEPVVWNIRRLLDAAKVLGVRTYATEQYPEKLGPTVSSLAERLETKPAGKQAFSCGECGEIFSEWREVGIQRVLVCGIEAHVCVQQTVLDLLAAGYQVIVAVDAVTSRYPADYEVALRRMEASGAVLTTTESAFFEWCVRAGTEEFKKISALAKESPPNTV